MAIPISFLHDENGDVDMSKGLRLTTDLATYVAQRLDEKLSFFLGEWFLDARLGIPYFEVIIGASPFVDLALIRTLFQRAILGQAGVASLDTLNIGFDRATRALDPFEFEATLNDGSKITQANLSNLFIVQF